MSFNFNDTTSIEDEISEMSSKIDIDKYMEEKREKEEKEGKKNKSSSTLNTKEINSSDEIEEEENSEESEESEERENKSKIEDKKMRRILKKFNFKYDEELRYNVESKMDEKDLSQEDYDDLNYLYIKFTKLYY